MLTAYIQHPDGTITRTESRDEVAAAFGDGKSLMWIDILEMTDDERKLLRDVFKFHELAIEECSKYANRPRIEHYEKVGDALGTPYFYMVIHGPDLKTFTEKLRTKEMDILMSQRYLITVHDEGMKSIETVRQRVDDDPRLAFAGGIDQLLYQLLDYLTDLYMPIMDHLEEEINDLEDLAADGNDGSVLERIVNIKRDLLSLRRVIGPQREVVAQLSRGDVQFILESNRVYFRDVLDHLSRTVEMLEIFRDLIQGARDIYLSSISLRLNQIMKTLTIISVVCLPMTIITGFFGMNFDEDWLFHSHKNFVIAMILMCMLVGSLLYFFKRNRWI